MWTDEYIQEILDAPQGEVMRDLWQNQVASNRNPLLKAQPVARLSDYSDIMRVRRVPRLLSAIETRLPIVFIFQFVNPAAGRDLTVVRLYRPIPTSSGADGYLTAMRSVPLPDQPIDSGAPLWANSTLWIHLQFFPTYGNRWQFIQLFVTFQSPPCFNSSSPVPERIS